MVQRVYKSHPPSMPDSGCEDEGTRQILNPPGGKKESTRPSRIPTAKRGTLLMVRRACKSHPPSTPDSALKTREQGKYLSSQDKETISFPQSTSLPRSEPILPGRLIIYLISLMEINQRAVQYSHERALATRKRSVGAVRRWQRLRAIYSNDKIWTRQKMKGPFRGRIIRSLYYNLPDYVPT